MGSTRSALVSEDDIRTKVVHQWLKNCGISEKEISIESTITIQLGRGKKTFISRSDVIVKNSAGNNLFIVEVKEPEHDLKTADQAQAISYARALAEGGIAPFTVLT